MQYENLMKEVNRGKRKANDEPEEETIEVESSALESSNRSTTPAIPSPTLIANQCRGDDCTRPRDIRQGGKFRLLCSYCLKAEKERSVPATAKSGRPIKKTKKQQDNTMVLAERDTNKDALAKRREDNTMIKKILKAQGLDITTMGLK
jgi:hypothetical protein